MEQHLRKKREREEKETTWVLRWTAVKYQMQPKNILHSIAVTSVTEDPLHFLEDTKKISTF